MKDLKLSPVTNFEDSRSIAREIFFHQPFPDHRLKMRTISVASTLLRHPGVPYSKAFQEWAATKAFYRLIENERIAMETLSAPIFESGARNCNCHQKIYAVNDTTAVALSHETLSKELGALDQFPDHLGLFLHTTLAVSSRGVPLGILDQQAWKGRHS